MTSLTGTAEMGLATAGATAPGHDAGTDSPATWAPLPRPAATPPPPPSAAPSPPRPWAAPRAALAAAGAAPPIHPNDLAICTPKLPIPTLKYGRPSVL